MLSPDLSLSYLGRNHAYYCSYDSFFFLSFFVCDKSHPICLSTPAPPKAKYALFMDEQAALLEAANDRLRAELESTVRAAVDAACAELFKRVKQARLSFVFHVS